MADASPTSLAGYEFDRATAVRPGPEPGVATVELDPTFAVGPKVHGGYLLAVLGRAAVDAATSAGASHPHVVAATATYLGSPDPGPATVEAEVLRIGRTATHVRTVLRQGGQTAIDATLILGVLPTPDDDGAAPTWSSVTPFDVAPREVCIRATSDNPMGFLVHINDRIDLRLDPASMRWTAGDPSGRGDLRGWISFPDDRPIDPLALLLFVDALPPPTFDVWPSGWVPTMALTTYLRAIPAPGPLRARVLAQHLGSGRVDEVCELWDSEDRLVAQATQIASIRLPEGTELPPYPR